MSKNVSVAAVDSNTSEQDNIAEQGNTPEQNNANKQDGTSGQDGSTINMALLETVLDTIRPSLQADGGDCELVGVTDEGVVMLELQGACAGCSLSNVTLSMGVERILKEHVPGVTGVQAVY